MTEEQYKQQLEKEGFTGITVCPNGPNTEFPEHTHDQRTVHIILKGGLTTVDKSVTNHYKPGDRFEVPAGMTHSAKCGPDGCTFIVGIKQK